VNREFLAKWTRVVVAGICTVAGMVLMGIPGNGLFLVIAGLAGLVAGLAVPGWIGCALLVGTVAAATVVGAYALGWYTGLLALVIASLVVPATAGWAVGYTLVRAHRLGIRAAVRDPRIVGAAVGMVAIIALIWYATVEFATNPP
jgi:hypothetical protein